MKLKCYRNQTFMCIHTYKRVCVYIFIYICRERERPIYINNHIFKSFMSRYVLSSEKKAHLLAGAGEREALLSNPKLTALEPHRGMWSWLPEKIWKPRSQWSNSLLSFMNPPRRQWKWRLFIAKDCFPGTCKPQTFVVLISCLLF